MPVSQKDWSARMWEYDIDAILEEHQQKMLQQMAKKIRTYLVSKAVLVEGNRRYGRRIELSEFNIADYFDDYNGSGMFYQILYCGLNCTDNLDRYLAQKICDYVPELDRRTISNKDLRALTQRINMTDWGDRVTANLRKRFPRKQVLFYLMKNPRYHDLVEDYEENRVAREQLHQTMLREIPDDYIDFYPLAREMHRYFYIHEGPTNSGKTYQAIQALKKSENGIYLGPLRLLAYEQFESLNLAGYPCDLITGEERMEVPGARYQASTVEMFNPERQYEMAVLDEAQMISDESRGGSWTSVMLGICAEEIHVCCAPNAVKLLVRLIEDCGDSYEIIHHDRQTPLRTEHEEFLFPKSVREKDALIVFSKRDVHAVASELQRKGISCSVIYGSLPYDVRHDEARKFMEGDTQVVVATDAIGMGMNLPIQRVVFLATAKFDGKDIRPLLPEEVQQIAGRAGRRGIFDVGYVNAFGDFPFIAESLAEKVPDLEYAVIAFPSSLLGLDARLSEILKRWNAIREKPGYRKEDLQMQIELCEQLEAVSGGKNKELIYQFLMIPFDEKEESLNHLWEDFFRAEYFGYEISFRDICPNLSNFETRGAADLPSLELAYKVCDLAYYYMQRFDHTEELDDIVEVKRRISDLIMEILDKQKLPSKLCRYCGKPLPWNYRYNMCQKCFRKRRWR